MGNAIRKIVVGAKKVPKSVLVITSAAKVRSQMEKIREFGYECTLIENIGEAMTFLRVGKRVNVVVLDIESAKSAEKLILWIREKRSGVRTICVNDIADPSEIPRTIREILEPTPEIRG